jgi:protein-tyrosine phosphatase
MKVLFVCLGNICRSPAAEGIFRNHFPDIHFDSAGTTNYHAGHGPDTRSTQVCQDHKVDINQLKARPLTSADGEIFDYILVMDEANLINTKKIIEPQHHKKIHQIDKHEIRDPYFSHADGFEIMFQHLESTLKHWKNQWK